MSLVLQQTPPAVSNCAGGGTGGISDSSPISSPAHQNKNKFLLDKAILSTAC
jgi:hypothetical protein